MFKGCQEQRNPGSIKAAVERRDILFTDEIWHRIHICMQTPLKMMHACDKSNLTHEAVHKHADLSEKCASSWVCPLGHLLHTRARITKIPSCNIINAFQ